MRPKIGEVVQYTMLVKAGIPEVKAALITGIYAADGVTEANGPEDVALSQVADLTVQLRHGEFRAGNVPESPTGKPVVGCWNRL